MTGEMERCEQCGTPLRPDGPRGLCPGCLMKRGLESEWTVSQGSGDARPERTPPPTPEELAPHFPGLEILGLIGRGGMGAVYKARQRELDRVVALKILARGPRRDPAFADRFRREAQALAKLHHPNIVTLYEFGEADGQFFFVMEFVEGVNLRQVMNAGRMAPKEALGIVPQICDALQFAHDRGVIHRDIKPENILLNKEGQVKIADFGVAKIVGGAPETAPRTGAGAPPELTRIGTTLGTPGYMAPEQASRPLEVDQRADIYSLGVVFYQMLTGEMPGRPIEPPSKKVLVDVRLDEVVLRALEQDPERRYQQVGEVRTMLETVLAAPMAASQETPPVTRAVGSWSRIVMIGRRDGKAVINWPGLALVFLIVLALVEAGGALLCWTLQVRMNNRAMVLGLLGAVMATGIGLARARTTPLGRLVDLDAPPARQVHPSHFSRLAIVGLVWLLLAVFGALTLSGGVPPSGWPWWKQALVWMVTFTTLTGPIAVTCLGWLAVSQIRRSKGGFHGLGLAVFDGLLFPLLALDVGIWLLVGNLWKRTYRPDVSRPFDAFLLDHEGIIPLGTLLLCLLVDFLIIRRTWRAVRRSATGASPAGSISDAASSVVPPPVPANPAPSALRGASATVAFHALLLVLVVVFAAYGVPRMVAPLRDFGAALPGVTVLAVNGARLVQRFWWLLFPPFLALDFGISYLLQRSGGRRARNAWSIAVALPLVLAVLAATGALARPLWQMSARLERDGALSGEDLSARARAWVMDVDAGRITEARAQFNQELQGRWSEDALRDWWRTLRVACGELKAMETPVVERGPLNTRHVTILCVGEKGRFGLRLSFFPGGKIEGVALLPQVGSVPPQLLTPAPPAEALPDAAFGPVIERTFSVSNVDEHRLVFFDVETGEIIKTTVVPRFRSRTEMQFLEVTPELRDCIHRTDVDLVFHFAEDAPEFWAYILLGMETQPLQTNPDQIQPQDIAAAFAAKDADRRASRDVRGLGRSGPSSPEPDDVCGSGRMGFCDPEAEKGQQRWDMFRTRTGAMGLISMVGVDSDKDRRTLGVVKLRYKLVKRAEGLAQPEAWITAVSGDGAAENYGPVVERTLRYRRQEDRLQHDVLWLKDGALSSLPAGFFDRSAAGNRQWLNQRGPGLFPGYVVRDGEPPKPGWGLGTAGMKFAIVPQEWWNAPPALRELADAVRDGRTLPEYLTQGAEIACLPDASEFPVTLALLNDETGACGLMQVLRANRTGTDPDPMTITLRYRLADRPGVPVLVSEESVDAARTAPRLQIRLEAAEFDESPWEPLPRPEMDRESRALHIRMDVLLDEMAVASVDATTPVQGSHQVELTLTPEGRERFAEVTTKNIGRRLAIVFDGRVLSAPVIRAPITGGKAVITGLTETEAAGLARVLQRTPVPAGRSPPQDLLGTWYGQYVDGRYLPSEISCIWEFRGDGKTVYTLEAMGEDGAKRVRTGTYDYEIDEQGRLVLFIPGEKTKYCPFEIRKDTVYISVDEPNDFVFTRQPHPAKYAESRERTARRFGKREHTPENAAAE